MPHEFVGYTIAGVIVAESCEPVTLLGARSQTPQEQVFLFAEPSPALLTDVVEDVKLHVAVTLC